MKNKKVLFAILFLIGIVFLTFSMFMIQGAENRLFSGILIFASVLIIGAAAKNIAYEFILKSYLERKVITNKKADKARENEVKQKSASRANLIVSVILAVTIIIMYFIKLNYAILTILIIASIILQSFLNALLYIYYDKKIKENKIEK